jgi:hypothetical protein
MLTAFLARSGGRVVIPDAVAVVAGETNGEIRFIDAEGRTLVTFQREDLVIYSRDDGFARADGNSPDGQAALPM